jgi:Helicase conserved C-terminal domain
MDPPSGGTGETVHCAPKFGEYYGVGHSHSVSSYRGTGQRTGADHNHENLYTVNLFLILNLVVDIVVDIGSMWECISAVKQLALPILSDMGEARFLVIDADRQQVQTIKNEADLARLNDSAASADTNANTAGSDGVDDDNESSRDSKKARGMLEKGEAMEAPQQLSQYYMTVSCKWRLTALLSFLKTHNHQKVMVFFATCDSVDYHALLLRETRWPVELDAAIEYTDSSSSSGYGGNGNDDDNDDFSSGLRGRGGSGAAKPKKVNASDNSSMTPTLEPLPSSFTGMMGKDCSIYRLHGNMPQNLRQDMYKQFCAAKSGIMLCTDVAARGLDLPEIDWILQYDPPCETTDYVHRVGRTAR